MGSGSNSPVTEILGKIRFGGIVTDCCMLLLRAPLCGAYNDNRHHHHHHHHHHQNAYLDDDSDDSATRSQSNELTGLDVPKGDTYTGIGSQ